MKSRGESGFAMLLVFALAAAVAITLYIETPRILFEAQRQKEQLLIDRGEEYKRAIQLYFRKTKQYPPTIDALENTNNVRFLRKKYEDPVSGKKEWRLIHVGPGGVFTDSLTNKPKDQGEKKDQAFNPYLVNSNILGSAPPPGAATAVPPRRASEGQQSKPGETTLIGLGQPQPGVAYQPQPPPFPGQSYPGQPSPAPLYPGQQVPGQTPSPGQPFFAGQPYQNQQIPGQQGASAPPPQAAGGFGSFYPAAPVNSQTGGVSQQPNPYPGQGSPYPNQLGGSNAFPVPGQNDATRMIGQLLTSPRPGGPPPGIGAPLGGGAQIGAGIAGVASLSEQTGIKIYNERDKYNEWEFIYDFSKDKAMVGAAAGVPAIGTPAGTAPFGTPAVPVQPSQTGGGSMGFQPFPGSFGQQPTGGGTFPGQYPGQQFPQPGIGGTGFVPRPGGQTGQNPVPLPSAGSSGGGFGGGFGSGFGGGFGAPATGAGQPGQPGAQPVPQPGVPVRPRNQ
ncbi:MAG: hypothetical protein EXQ52_08810 [Bryobacterales bacterium]|nr:hypothetical protein [Bryobacterales bacterium]